MDGCIFEGQIPVRVKHNDLDERQAQLTLRITQEVRKPGSHPCSRMKWYRSGSLPAEFGCEWWPIVCWCAHEKTLMWKLPRCASATFTHGRRDSDMWPPSCMQGDRPHQ